MYGSNPPPPGPVQVDCILKQKLTSSTTAVTNYLTLLRVNEKVSFFFVPIFWALLVENDWYDDSPSHFSTTSQMASTWGLWSILGECVSLVVAIFKSTIVGVWRLGTKISLMKSFLKWNCHLVNKRRVCWIRPRIIFYCTVYFSLCLWLE